MTAILNLIAISKRFLKTAKQDGWPVGDLTKAIQDAETELAAKDAKTEAARSDAEKLRRNFAKYLAPEYIELPHYVAGVCDEEIDKTGELLGYVREYAALKDAK